MRVNNLDLRVVVRRVTVGSAPYCWEIRSADGISPVQVSPDRFRSMDTALKEGQAWLADFLSQPRLKRRRSQATEVAPGDPAAEPGEVSELLQEPQLDDSGHEQSLEQGREADMERHGDLPLQSGASAPADADWRW